jgi:uncharacterized protein YfbU (UPF0304 family)
MRLSDGETLILAMLCDLYERLNIDSDHSDIDPKFVQKAILNGNLWSLEEKYDHLLHNNEHDETLVREVGDILDAWRLIERSFTELSDTDKASVKEAFGKELRFKGFDGNFEGEYASVAKVLIDDLGGFTEFKERNLTSCATHTLPLHRRLVAGLQRMALSPGGLLSADQLIEVLTRSA